MTDREAAMQAENERLREQLTTQSSEATMFRRERDKAVELMEQSAEAMNPGLPVPDVLGMIRADLDAEDGNGTSVDEILAELESTSTPQQAPRVNRDDLDALADMVRRS